MGGYEGHDGFRPGYSCKNQVVMVFQGIVDSLDKADRTDAITVDISKPLRLVPHDRLIMKIAAPGVGMRVVVWVKKFLLGRSQSKRATIGGSQSNLRSAARERNYVI